MFSCNKIERQNNISKSKTTPKTETVSKDNTDLKSIEDISRPNKSEILNPKYDANLIFGIWTNDVNGPHADFEITKKYFFVVDYDGNGEMTYLINNDSLKVFYNDFISVGIITKATKDSLSINWDNNGISNYVKWTN